MIQLGMHVDNWRHLDVTYEVPCQFASDQGMEYVEFGTIDGDYFIPHNIRRVVIPAYR